MVFVMCIFKQLVEPFHIYVMFQQFSPLLRELQCCPHPQRQSGAEKFYK